MFFFCYLVITSPWKRTGHFNWTNLIPFTQDALCQVWLKFAQWFWRRRWKCEKFTTTTTTTRTNNEQILIRKAHLSLRLRWAKTCQKGSYLQSPAFSLQTQIIFINEASKGSIIYEHWPPSMNFKWLSSISRAIFKIMFRELSIIRILKSVRKIIKRKRKYFNIRVILL